MWHFASWYSSSLASSCMNVRKIVRCKKFHANNDDVTTTLGLLSGKSWTCELSYNKYSRWRLRAKKFQLQFFTFCHYNLYCSVFVCIKLKRVNMNAVAQQLKTLETAAWNFLELHFMVAVSPHLNTKTIKFRAFGYFALLFEAWAYLAKTT